jgi:hypothetical protein
MNRPLFLAALRVLSSSNYPQHQPRSEDIQLLRANALPEEQCLSLEDLARAIV